MGNIGQRSRGNNTRIRAIIHEGCGGYGRQNSVVKALKFA